MFRVELEPCILPNAMLVGIQAGQDVHVRRKGEDVVRVGIRKDDSTAGQGIEKRRADARIAGIAEGVGARCVDRNQNDVARRTGRRGNLMAKEKQCGDSDRGHRRDELEHHTIERPAPRRGAGRIRNYVRRSRRRRA